MKKITLSLFMATFMGSTLFASPASVVENYINSKSGANPEVKIKCADKSNSIICGTTNFSKTEDGVSISFDKFAFVTDSELGSFLQDYDIEAVQSYENYKSRIKNYEMQKMQGQSNGEAPVMNESAKIGKNIYNSRGDYKEKIFGYLQKAFITDFSITTEDGLNYTIGELILKKTNTPNSFSKPITGKVTLEVKDVIQNINTQMIIKGLQETKKDIIRGAGENPQGKQIAESIFYIVKKIIEKNSDKNGNYSLKSNGKIVLLSNETSKGTINLNLKTESNDDKGNNDFLEIDGDVIGISVDKKDLSDGRFNKLVINSKNPSLKIMAELIKSDEMFKTHVQRLEGLIDMGKGMSSSFITDIRLSKLARNFMEKLRSMLYGKEDSIYFSITNKTGITNSEMTMESQKIMMNMGSQNQNQKSPDSVVADAIYKNFDINFK